MLLVIFLKDLYHKESQISRFIMEIKNGIIIDGVLHEMSKTFNENFDCSECSLVAKDAVKYADALIDELRK